MSLSLTVWLTNIANVNNP
jgi:hypothetical protein